MNIEKLFEFIKERRGYDYPLRYKLLNGIELTEGDLTVNGDLNLILYKLSSLPDNLRVKGDMWLDYSDRIFSLPDNLHVGGNLSIEFTDISSIPNNLYVGGNFGVRYTPLAELYTKEQILKMIDVKGGNIGGVTIWTPLI